MTPADRTKRLANIAANAATLAPYSELARDDVPWLLAEIARLEDGELWTGDPPPEPVHVVGTGVFVSRSERPPLTLEDEP